MADLSAPATIDPDEIEASVEDSRRRLRRDRIDIVLLHLNSLSVAEANAIFDRLETLRSVGRIGYFGWSTDFPANVAAMAARPGISVNEHAMNVFFAADGMEQEIAKHNLLQLIRSPLAMGLLGGRYSAGHRFAPDDVRSRTAEWMDYFKDGRVTSDHAERLDRLRDVLTAGGRSMTQGALAWILARGPQAVPVPGFRTVEQIEDLCGVLLQGPLEPEALAGVESAIERAPEGLPRER